MTINSSNFTQGASKAKTLPAGAGLKHFFVVDHLRNIENDHRP